jgi:hypothetical protein
LFGAYQNPCDNQIRKLLDEVSPSEIFPIFHKIFNELYHTGYFKPFESVQQSLLVALDGVEYFHSTKIHCDGCSKQTFPSGVTHYSHKAITPAIISPQQSTVIPLTPEFMMPQDGHDKQDCELAAAIRWLKRESELFSGIKISILGDDLYSHQSYCEAILAQKLHFILVCKQESHKTLYEWLADFERLEKISTYEKKTWDGKHRSTYQYRFMNQLPLRDGDDALMVNWCELKVVRDDGKVLYYNTFITDYPISAENIVQLVEAGRSRWKIENENNNTLKTKGYHFEHNFGHGTKYLASVLASLILLAFLFHTILEHFDKCYQLLRKTLSSREMFFDDVRALTRYICFESWRQMLEFMLKGLEIPIPDAV